MTNQADPLPGEKRKEGVASSSSAPDPPWDGGMAFLTTVHGRVNEDSRFADTKAAAVIVLATGLIASLQGAKLHLGVLTKAFSQWGPLEPLSALAYCLLGAGVFLAAWAIKPRLNKAHDRGFLFWACIRGYSTPDEFWRDFHSHNARDLTEHLAHHVFTLAGVCKAKYFWLGLSMWTSFLGALAAMAAVLLKDALFRPPGT